MKPNAKIQLLFALFSLSTLIIFGLNMNVEAQKKTNSEILITIEREACFGSCPVYLAQIYTNGTVIYKGKDFVKVKAKRRYKISKDKVRELIKAFEQIKYFSLKDNYQSDEKGMSVTDLPTTITSISLDGKQKKVVNYYGAPKELDELANTIERIAGLDKFIIPL